MLEYGKCEIRADCECGSCVKVAMHMCQGAAIMQ